MHAIDVARGPVVAAGPDSTIGRAARLMAADDFAVEPPAELTRLVREG